MLKTTAKTKATKIIDGDRSPVESFNKKEWLEMKKAKELEAKRNEAKMAPKKGKGKELAHLISVKKAELAAARKKVAAKQAQEEEKHVGKKRMSPKNPKIIVDENIVEASATSKRQKKGDVVL